MVPTESWFERTKGDISFGRGQSKCVWYYFGGLSRP
jgi:hypothetical protein